MLEKNRPSILSALTLALLSMLLVAARPAQAVTETVLYNFSGGSDGGQPYRHLAFDGAGNIYGTTSVGGANSEGTVYELSPNGSGGWNETVLYSFCAAPGCTDGSSPFSYVVFDGAGNLYGTTEGGGTNGYGTVWELSPSGGGWTETVLVSLDGPNAAYAANGLVRDAAGNFYGAGATGLQVGGYGTIFEVSPSGGGYTQQLIYGINDSSSAGLAMDAAGNIYGAGYSTVFELSPNGSGGWNPTVIHAFAGGPKDGWNAEGTPVLDKSGNIYGTTNMGGKYGAGTVYKLTPVMSGKKKGTYTEKVLWSFKGGTKDGSGPWAEVVLDTAGNIYGTTTGGGKSGDGTVFELVFSASTGKYKEKVLWSFNYTDGDYPIDGLILDGAGNLYGTTYEGGSGGAGTVFELTP